MSCLSIWYHMTSGMLSLGASSRVSAPTSALASGGFFDDVVVEEENENEACARTLKWPLAVFDDGRWRWVEQHAPQRSRASTGRQPGLIYRGRTFGDASVRVDNAAPMPLGC
jgi:hypothetical protein